MIENGSGDPDNDWRLGEFWCDSCDAYHVGHNWTLDGTGLSASAHEIWWQRRVDPIAAVAG